MALTSRKPSSRSAAGPGLPTERDRDRHHAAELGAERGLREEFDGGALLLADARTAFILINQARRQTISRLFGVSGADANIVTLIGIMLMADAARQKARRLFAAGAPAGPDAMLGLASVRELLADAAGPGSRETPLTSTFLLAAVLVGLTRPALAKKAAATAGRALHTVGADFHHRYGYLVDPGHLRRQRARRRLGGSPTPVPTDQHLGP